MKNVYQQSVANESILKSEKSKIERKLSNLCVESNALYTVIPTSMVKSWMHRMTYFKPFEGVICDISNYVITEAQLSIPCSIEPGRLSIAVFNRLLNDHIPAFNDPRAWLEYLINLSRCELKNLLSRPEIVSRKYHSSTSPNQEYALILFILSHINRFFNVYTRRRFRLAV
jgi:hypothetical protein